MFGFLESGWVSNEELAQHIEQWTSMLELDVSMYQSKVTEITQGNNLTR
ncbi:MAG: hypothetical protein AAF846_27930 [Chloroflexota bacterium]